MLTHLKQRLIYKFVAAPSPFHLEPHLHTVYTVCTIAASIRHHDNLVDHAPVRWQLSLACRPTSRRVDIHLRLPTHTEPMLY